MQLWRIATDTRDYEAHDTSGAGAAKSAGRWNAPGTPMLYCSMNPSLACLETMAHLGATLPLNRYLVSLEVPDAVWARAPYRSAASLPVGWDAVPEGLVSVQVGQDWVKAASSAILRVPSAIVPEDVVVLINPQHPDAAGISAKKLRKWLYDPRLRAR